MLKKGEILELRIEDLAYQGKAIARLDGLVIFLDRGIPGDVVRAKITKVKPNYLEAEAEEIKESSDLRVHPPCEHFGTCGGCRLQDLKYEEQLKFKTKQVKETLEHIAGVVNAPVEETIPSPDIFFYRNKMEFSFGKGSEGELILGLHQLGRYDRNFDLAKCFLQSGESNRIVEWVRGFFREKKILPYDVKDHQGFLRYLVLKESKSTGEMLVNLVTYLGGFEVAPEFIEGLGGEFPCIKGIVRNINSRLANVACGQEQIVLYGQDYILEKVGDFLFGISTGSFFQTNSRQVERLYGLIRELADLKGGEEVWDLYSGTGAISIFLSEFARRVIAVESSQEANRDAKKNAQVNDAGNCEFLCAEVKQFLKESVGRKDSIQLAILDPPRAGLHPKVVRYLVELNIPKIIYVSCNPSTLSRDLKMFLACGYDLKRICPVDMFPHTFHIECVVGIEKKAG